MKLFISIIFILCTVTAFAGDKEDIQHMIESVNIKKSTVYIYNGNLDEKIMRHINQFSFRGEGQVTNDYFQDFLFNFTYDRFHLVHFLKNADGTYRVFLDTDLSYTGDFKEDLKTVLNPKLLSATAKVTFDQNGYPSSELKTATDTRFMQSSDRGLIFSIQGGIREQHRTYTTMYF